MTISMGRIGTLNALDERELIPNKTLPYIVDNTRFIDFDDD